MREQIQIECFGKKRLRQRPGEANDASIWCWVKSGRLPQQRQIGSSRVALQPHEVEDATMAFHVVECRLVYPGARRGRKLRSVKEVKS